MKRSLLAVLAFLAALASPGVAVAGQPHGFPGTSPSLSYANGTFLAAIDGPQSIYDVVSPLGLAVSVVGPPGGSKIWHVAVSIRGIDCALDHEGALFTKLLDVDGTQNVEGHLRFEPQGRAVCEGQFLGGSARTRRFPPRVTVRHPPSR